MDYNNRESVNQKIFGIVLWLKCEFYSFYQIEAQSLFSDMFVARK